MNARWSLLVGVAVVACSSAEAVPDAGGSVPDAETDSASAQDAATHDALDGSADVTVSTANTVNASPTFGMTVNSTNNHPKVSYGTHRFWDSPPFQWATLQTAKCTDVSTCTGGYDTGNMAAFDAYLANMKTAGAETAWYTMARTPNFISAFPNDAKCNYTGSNQGGLGQCDRPSDLHADGTGTNIAFRTWYAFFAKRNNDATYLKTHAHISFWEPWNEPDTQAFWGDGNGGHGSYDALVRLMQDTECLIVGAVGTGTITKTGETCAQVQASVGLSAPIDPSAIVVSPSYHAKTASLSQYQNFLYCNNSPSVSCTSGDAGAKSMMAFNLHMKPGAECVPDSGNKNCTTATSVEPAYAAYIKSFEGILQPTELAAFQAGTVPLFDGEASYSPTGFVAPFTDHDMAASWIPRFFLYGWSLGVTGNEWYTWDEISGNTKVTTAWDTLYSVWVGSVPASKPFCTNAGTIYTCSFTKATTAYEVIWDTAQSCSNGTCSTANQSVASDWTTYQDLTGTAAACVTPCAISGASVPVGIKPVLLAK